MRYIGLFLLTALLSPLSFADSCFNCEPWEELVQFSSDANDVVKEELNYKGQFNLTTEEADIMHGIAENERDIETLAHDDCFNCEGQRHVEEKDEDEDEDEDSDPWKISLMVRYNITDDDGADNAEDAKESAAQAAKQSVGRSPLAKDNASTITMSIQHEDFPEYSGNAFVGRLSNGVKIAGITGSRQWGKGSNTPGSISIGGNVIDGRMVDDENLKMDLSAQTITLSAKQAFQTDPILLSQNVFLRAYGELEGKKDLYGKAKIDAEITIPASTFEEAERLRRESMYNESVTKLSEAQVAIDSAFEKVKDEYGAKEIQFQKERQEFEQEVERLEKMKERFLSLPPRERLKFLPKVLKAKKEFEEVTLPNFEKASEKILIERYKVKLVEEGHSKQTEKINSALMNVEALANAPLPEFTPHVIEKKFDEDIRSTTFGAKAGIKAGYISDSQKLKILADVSVQRTWKQKASSDDWIEGNMVVVKAQGSYDLSPQDILSLDIITVTDEEFNKFPYRTTASYTDKRESQTIYIGLEDRDNGSPKEYLAGYSRDFKDYQTTIKLDLSVPEGEKLDKSTIMLGITKQFDL